MKMSLRDARLQVMRGNLDPKLLKKEEVAEIPAPAPVPEPKPEPIAPIVAGPTNVVIDMDPVARSIMQVGKIQSDVLELMLQAKAISKWNFRVTERDRMGNIISFTAEPTNG